MANGLVQEPWPNDIASGLSLLLGAYKNNPQLFIAIVETRDVNFHFEWKLFELGTQCPLFALPTSALR